MKFNPAKCVYLGITIILRAVIKSAVKTSNKPHQPSSTYLGVTIDQNLDHVDKICNKANIYS